MQENKKMNIRKSTVVLTTFAVLMAAEVVLNLLEIHTGTIKINLAFIPVAVAAYLYGAFGGIAVYGLGDILGCLIHPVGAWYPPITITYALMGGIYGLLLKNSKSIVKTAFAVVINQWIVSLFITSLWISLLMYKPGTDGFFSYYITVIATMRLLPAAIMTALQLIIIPVTLRALEKTGFAKRLVPFTDRGKRLRRQSADKI